MEKFKTIFLDEAVEFLDNLTEQARQKIFYNIRKVQGGLKSNDLFKKLEGTSIWEFRTLYNGIQYRLFAFWDTEEETLVVATHGIVKKVWRIPSKEIAKAEAIREVAKAKAKERKIQSIELIRFFIVSHCFQVFLLQVLLQKAFLHKPLR